MFGKKKSGRAGGRRGKIQDSMRVAQDLSDYTKVTVDEQQQAKIVLYFLNGQKIDAIPEGRAEVTEAERKKVIAALKSGKIGEGAIEKFLLQVMMPLEDAETNARAVFQKIIEFPKQRQILAVATGHDANNWRMVNEADLKNLVEKPIKGQIDYRTPVGFAKFRQSFLEGIEDQASAEQMAEYNRAMDGLEEKIYGRRFDYYRQIHLMMMAEIATEEMSRAEQVEKTEEIAAPEAVPEVKPKTSRANLVASEMAMVAAQRSEEILAKTIVMGDAWRQDGNEYRLNTASLANAGLTPAAEMNLEGLAVAWSLPFQLSDGRGAVLGYVNTEDGWKLRSYFLNPRTGMWHFAPDVIRGPRGEGMSQITEGYGVAATMLPATVQQRLAELVRANGFREITTVNADFIFAGTCAMYDSLQEYREALNRGQMRSDFYKEVDVQPMMSNWQANAKNKNVPQLLSVSREMAPNFQNKVAIFQTYSLLAGQVLVEAFAANDESVNWVFCGDDWHRTWVANAEVISPVTSTGCYKSWMLAGDMATPLYEHSTRAGSYGDTSDTRKGGMVGMWRNYLSNIPIIRQKLESSRE